ncbi:uncharacterized protein G2W53_037976 [Senna tora]|uniref:Uncharacterized protein n=1 Tax=Senna tora TaxID=362788 RepID=A0A834SNC9_9FABA|nr:uncharacterized protein G2W53_037976 [Senna tora]
MGTGLRGVDSIPKNLTKKNIKLQTD